MERFFCYQCWWWWWFLMMLINICYDIYKWLLKIIYKIKFYIVTEMDEYLAKILTRKFKTFKYISLKNYDKQQLIRLKNWEVMSKLLNLKKKIWIFFFYDEFITIPSLLLKKNIYVSFHAWIDIYNYFTFHIHMAQLFKYTNIEIKYKTLQQKRKVLFKIYYSMPNSSILILLFYFFRIDNYDNQSIL